MRCSSCGAEVSGAGRFCENCGAPLGDAGREAVAQPAQPVGSENEYASYGTSQSTQPAEVAGFYGGSQPMTQMSYSAAPQAKQGSNVPFVLAIIALVTAILGLFPISLVLAIVALAMNSGQKKRGEMSTKQTPTFVMGLISLILSILMFVLVLIFGGLLAATIVNGNIDLDDIEELSSRVSSVSASGDGASASDSAIAPIPDADAASSDFVGTWEVELFEDDGHSYGAEYLDMMRGLGMKVELVVGADGTAVLDVLDEQETGTWSDAGGGKVDFVFDGETVTATLSEGKLMWVDGSDKLVFHRAS